MSDNSTMMRIHCLNNPEYYTEQNEPVNRNEYDTLTKDMSETKKHAEKKFVSLKDLKPAIDKVNPNDLNAINKTILYIFKAFSDNPEQLTETKLNRILWFADSEGQATLKKTLTGEYLYKVQNDSIVLPKLPLVIKLFDKDNAQYYSRNFLTPKRIKRILNSDYARSLNINLSQKKKNILDFWINALHDKDSKQLNSLNKNYSWWKKRKKGFSLLIHFGSTEVLKAKKGWI